ncbi:MAG: OsmC family protein [Lentimicrobiaceae bacterium]|jgi:putative redox protein|nr:OsmC family protein [Lentimicrobiaceae bacterium]MCP4909544.1 OsmC family protein [Bacteroidota bacterium]MBT3453454.1 OsmC family protein [Lentimicrobiaceae bacterium]MBT3819007.1 OsmC family protein [Lentimicrobiaceae bacterium]MBT4060464.1 OsmC family protein [Lentimicrobiaceae bacterium]
MNNKINVSWSGEMAFEAEVNDFKIKLDADEKVGGKNSGPRPKALSLVSLGGCTGMDVVSILAKMRVVPETFDVEVTGELTEEHPKYYDKIHLVYSFTGKDLPYAKLEKAINLSQERYCGVNAMLSKAAEVTYEIRVDE